MMYDKAKYHFESVEEEGLEISQAYVHSGFYFGWLIDNNLMSEEFAEDCAQEIALFLKREITAPRLFEEFDGVLSDQELSEQGNSFSQDYFETGNYFNDYGEFLSDSLASEFHVQDSWENYQISAEFISKRYQKWLAGQG
ncbi:hypothetical protein D8682_08425 [Buttiauxella sp. 3AFRM03]|uniref:DUF7832 domain-containing protein n=1 Tax=Buttiauxella sp. 3AFRM03 TaxID=2479367 RepID=UPI000EF7D01E|nr:hypothetical protein [Buttiauxella sp. 3AFRM03]AYN27015.1 hypothetical protein D8682_08425 [Buttiauxella sp. 3AFRM03]